MTRMIRSSAVLLALGYIGLGCVALVLFAAPLWYAWQGTIQAGTRRNFCRPIRNVSRTFYRESGVDGP